MTDTCELAFSIFPNLCSSWRPWRFPFLNMKHDRTTTWLVATLFAIAATGESRSQAQGPGGPPAVAASVVVSPVVEREVTAGQNFVGTVMPLEEGDDRQRGRRPRDRVSAQRRRPRRAGPAARPAADRHDQARSRRPPRPSCELRRQELAELENGTRPEETRPGQGADGVGRGPAQVHRRPAGIAGRSCTTRIGAISEEELDESGL